MTPEHEALLAQVDALLDEIESEARSVERNGVWDSKHVFADRLEAESRADMAKAHRRVMEMFVAALAPSPDTQRIDALARYVEAAPNDVSISAPGKIWRQHWSVWRGALSTQAATLREALDVLIARGPLAAASSSSETST